MIGPEEGAQDAPTESAVRDVIAVVVLMGGIGCAAWAGFLWSERIGLAVLGALLIGYGWLLGRS